jgi:hypothetical protein
MLLAQLIPTGMMLLGFVAVLYFSVTTIGVWPTVALWGVLLGVFGTGMVFIARRMRRR